MNDVEIKTGISAAVGVFSKGDFSGNGLELFKTLGYNTDRRDPFPRKTFQFFKESFLEGETRFNEEKARVKDWKEVDLLFQLTKDEVAAQHRPVDTGMVDRTIMESYLFLAIELMEAEYTRTVLARISREVNKVFAMPVMVLFKTGNCLTLSIIDRRLNKKDEHKDVLEKITLIKDIDIENPHRAHIEILFDLSFDRLKRKHRVANIVDLHNAWRKTLDTRELNQRFFQELSNWYFWAINYVSFPDDIEKKEDVRNATNLIRLLTRIVFIWFIKEKKLVPDVLFDRGELGRILKEFSRDRNSHGYYQAILQNLFFGTLNQKRQERDFAKEGTFNENKSNYGVKNLFRYSDRFSIGKKEALELFEDIPFLNGGLFDCLDKENDEGRVQYVDGFSRNPQKRAIVPDFLFFGPEEEYDLNAIYDTKNRKYKVKGLIDILSGYKFTIVENTPIEEEIALDPELLGKVFENLLASYNPETRTTARKQTGSFYTPREIVGYMVDESIKAYLKQKLETAAGMKSEDADVALGFLLEYNEKEHLFDERQTAVLIHAIDTCKILDPACGSGAFPMGILHKFVHILHKLDPGNKLWKDRQVEKVKAMDDPVLRDKYIADIEAAFENNELDYGRKLYLIENCIYGVDIQPIAIQISKLRFFISLVVDQKVNRAEDENYGIRSLPNLETKFVSANTLIGLDKPAQKMLKNPAIDKLEKDLKELRHRYFSAKNRREKLDFQSKDKTLRQEISDLLVLDGFPREAAKQVAAFDPYDQNASCSFFDPEWMFGLTGGFDVAIGNPPYVQIQSFSGMPQQKDWERQEYETYAKTGDVYCLFYERGYRLLKDGGTLVFITSNKWMRANYGKAMRKFFMANGVILKLIDFGDSPIFKNATTYTNILVWHKVNREVKTGAWDLSRAYAGDASLDDLLARQGEGEPLFTDESFVIVKSEQAAIKKRIEEIGVPLKDWNIAINYGIKTGLNEAFIIDGKKKDELIAEDPKSAGILKPILRGRDIKRYKAEFAGLWVIVAKFGSHGDIKKKYPAIFQHLANFKSRLEERGQCRYTRSGKSKQNEKYPGQHHWLELDNNPKDDYIALFNQDKIVWPETSLDNQFCLVGKDFFQDKTSFLLASDNKYLLGILNSRVTRFFLDFLVSKMRGGYFAMSKIYVEQIPIPHIDAEAQLPFEILVDMILFAREHAMNSDASTLEWVIDVMTFGLYFEPEMKKDHCFINHRIAEVIKPFTSDDTDDFKTEYIKTFVKFCDKDDTIRHGLVHSRLVKPVRIILGDKK
jgi:adenine-specific DNA-methyltransferase